MDDFTLYLMSDTSKAYFPLNSSSMFTVKLDKAISFQNYADWELTMLDIIYPSAICTLNGETIAIWDENGDEISVLHFPSIQCTSLTELVTQLNHGHKYFQFAIEHPQRIKLTVFAPYTIVVQQALTDILCFDQSNIPHQATPVISSDTPSLTRHVDYLYVYTNIGHYVRVGDVQAPLLRYFPFTSSSSSSQKSKTFIKRLFVGLNQSHIEQIEVSIRDGAGELVPFSDANATTQLTLQFRRRRH